MALLSIIHLPPHTHTCHIRVYAHTLTISQQFALMWFGLIKTYIRIEEFF